MLLYREIICMKVSGWCNTMRLVKALVSVCASIEICHHLIKVKCHYGFNQLQYAKWFPTCSHFMCYWIRLDWMLSFYEEFQLKYSKFDFLVSHLHTIDASLWFNWWLTISNKMSSIFRQQKDAFVIHRKLLTIYKLYITNCEMSFVSVEWN